MRIVFFLLFSSIVLHQNAWGGEWTGRVEKDPFTDEEIVLVQNVGNNLRGSSATSLLTYRITGENGELYWSPGDSFICKTRNGISFEARFGEAPPINYRATLSTSNSAVFIIDQQDFLTRLSRTRLVRLRLIDSCGSVTVAQFDGDINEAFLAIGESRNRTLDLNGNTGKGGNKLLSDSWSKVDLTALGWKRIPYEPGPDFIQKIGPQVLFTYRSLTSPLNPSGHDFALMVIEPMFIEALKKRKSIRKLENILKGTNIHVGSEKFKANSLIVFQDPFKKKKPTGQISFTIESPEQAEKFISSVQNTENAIIKIGENTYNFDFSHFGEALNVYN